MSLAQGIASMATQMMKRGDDDSDPGGGDSAKEEVFKAWAIFLCIMLLIAAFFASYVLQQRKITAIHETVVSIFAGMCVGLGLLIFSGDSVRTIISFDFQFFFNLLLPPIILASGYELHQANFFRNIGIILTFAFAGTFLSAVVIGLILFLFALLPGTPDLTFVDAISVGATLSATDPVTILAIFNAYKVDPKLYTIIFGESILNDAVAIVIFETAQKYKQGGDSHSSSYGLVSFFEGTGIFLLLFSSSLAIGVVVGVATALLLKFTYIRRFPKIESCLVLLIAYATYFFSHAVHLSGIVSLLFCGITLKHYAYFNMSRRTQLVTKFVFQVTSQLAENFIFIYLGLALFSDSSLDFQPPLIIVTIIAVCAARWVAVFPLSKIINWFTMYRASRRGTEIAPPLPYNYQAMLFWAGLRGAVGVALAALLDGGNAYIMRATVLVVVVLTVIIFGGTTARMLDILGIKTGVVEEIDSDDEFDIESFGGGLQAKRSGTGIGYNPRRARTLSLSNLDIQSGSASYVSGHRSPLIKSANPLSRKNSSRDIEHAGLLGRPITADDSDLGSDIDTSDLPPLARRSPMRNSPPPQPAQPDSIFATEGGESSGAGGQNPNPITATGAIRQLWAAEDPAGLLRQIDEDYIKPKLLLHGDNNTHNGSGPG